MKHCLLTYCFRDFLTSSSLLPFSSLPPLVPSYVAVLLSVTMVLIFGEILPSALFSGPNQLKIAARMASFVWQVVSLSYLLLFLSFHPYFLLLLLFRQSHPLIHSPSLLPPIPAPLLHSQPFSTHLHLRSLPPSLPLSPLGS